MKNRIHTFLFPFEISIFVISLFSVSCKKDTDILNASAQDQEDVLNGFYSDTATMVAHTINVDSVVSFNDAVKFLGSNQDPVFGRTDVSLYTKFSIPNNLVGVSFPDANLVSSEIVIAVKSLDFVGDYQCPLTYEVFEMNQNIPTTQSYFSKPKSWYNSGNLLASRTCSFDVINGLFVVRIPVNNTYASAILNNPQYLLDNTTLQNTYKGFYITCRSTNLNPVSAQGVIAKLDLDNALSGFYLNYQEGEISASKQTKVFKFPFSGTDVVRFNEFKHDATSGAHNLLTQQLQGDSAKGSQGLFLQGLGGAKVKFKIPFLTNFTSQHKISVNQAQIRFKVDQGISGSDGKYGAPLKLAVLAMDSASREIFTYDQISSSDFMRYYGGSYDYESKEYVFNISRDIQAIMNGSKKNWGFYLVVADGDRAYAVRRDDRSERIVIGGSASTLYKPVFKLTYTPLSND
ncbi:MAG: DUF4270 family protein [Sphingobacteriaceae bacterium]|nr:DUF4270 family protein [Sphingobacteriaceae bacterium]